MTDIHMHPPGVHGAGDDLAELASSAKAKTGHALDASGDVADAHPGWASSAALQGCRTAWSKHLTDLVDEVDAAAQKLHDSASGMEQADAEAARRLELVLQELSSTEGEGG